MEDQIKRQQLEKIDEVIKFICLNTEITPANLPDFRLSINNLYEVKSALAEKDQV